MVAGYVARTAVFTAWWRKAPFVPYGFIVGSRQVDDGEERRGSQGGRDECGEKEEKR